MSASNRSTLIAKSYKVLKKHYAPVAPVERSVLETLVYAACLENAKYDAANEGFRQIKDVSYDWNEVRVTSVTELSESLPNVPEPKQAAANVKRLLHGIFESIYAFDLEYLKKQNLGKSVKELSKHKGATPFVIGYVTQHALGGHSIPLDRGALEVLFITGVIDEKERAQHKAPGLERAIAKAKGFEYASLLHQLGADFVASPFSPKVRAVLLEINPTSKDRFPKRQSKKKKATPEPAAKKEKKATPAKKTPPKKKAVASTTKKKTVKKTPAKKTKPTKKKKATKAAKKTTAKKKKKVVKKKKRK